MVRRIISGILVLAVISAAFPVCFAEEDPPYQDDKFARINQDLDEAHGLMAKNISDMTKGRFTSAEEVEGQIEDLQKMMDNYEKTSANLRRTMWWKNTGAKLGIVGAIAVLVTVIVGGITWIVTAVKKHNHKK